MHLHHVVVIHHVEPSHVSEIAELGSRVARRRGREPLGERMWLDLQHGGGSGFTGLLVRQTDTGALAGYCQLHREPEAWALELMVDADGAPGDEDLGPSLLGAAINEIGRQGGGWVNYRVPAPTDGDAAAASHAGFAVQREIHQLRITLPLGDEVRSTSPSVAVRAFRPGIDDAAWLTLNNRAFAGHPEQGDWDLDLLREREAQTWFDPAGLLLHESEGRLAASCWTKVHGTGDSALGEIYVIAVDPAFQGRGLGRALTVAGLDHLASRGLHTGMLYVDDSNMTARHLYRALGFRLDHTDCFYSLFVPVGSDIGWPAPDA
ncbi:MAG: mycothiol synthase [Acidimicrobiales bacterium]